MINDEIVSVIARFFEGGAGPSHEELTRLIGRVGLRHADPRTTQPNEQVGKMRRLREVLSFAIDSDPPAGEKLIHAVIGAVRSYGAFRPEAPGYAGSDQVEAARVAFKSQGYELDPAGELHPAVLDNLEGAELTHALQNYVRRAQRGSTDEALLVGTDKDLMEAVARHVLVTRVGTYPMHGRFDATLWQAYEAAGLTTPDMKAIESLESDPERALAQVCWLMAVVVNRLRNAEGAGHGRPFPPSVSQKTARLATIAAGLVTQLLLDEAT